MQKYVKSTIFIIVSSALFIGALFSFYQINHFDDHQSVQSTTALYFFKDNCSDCRSIQKDVLVEKIENPNMKLINVNSQSNKKYIAKYGLTEVPTLIYVRPDGTYKEVFIGKDEVVNHIENRD